MMIPLTHPPSPPDVPPKNGMTSMHGSLGCGDKIFQGLKSAAQKLLGKPSNEDFFVGVGFKEFIFSSHVFDLI